MKLCKLFLIRIVTWSYDSLLKTIIIISLLASFS